MAPCCKASKSYSEHKLVPQKKAVLVYKRRPKPQNKREDLPRDPAKLMVVVYKRRPKPQNKREDLPRDPAKLKSLLVYKRRPQPQSKWEDLPRDPAELILKQLNLGEYCRLAVICSSWRSVALDNPTSKQLPWLMLPSDPKEDARIFCSPFDQKKDQFQVDGFSGGRCCGSVVGWMIMSYGNGRCSLLNPFSRAKIQLPSPKTILLPSKFRVTPDRLKRCPRSQCSLEKAVLSSAPSSDGCLIAGIFNDKKLAICRPQDKRWNLVEDQALDKEYCDLIYFKGQFFALDMKGGITVFDAELSPKARSWDMSSSYKSRGNELKGRLYLVESFGSLLMVERRDPSKSLVRTSPLNDEVSGATCNASVCCTIYKLDFDRVRWAKIDDITRWLGPKSSREQLFFLGPCNSWSVRSDGFPKLDKVTTFAENQFIFKQSFTDNAALYFLRESYDTKTQPMWIGSNPW